MEKPLCLGCGYRSVVQNATLPLVLTTITIRTTSTTIIIITITTTTGYTRTGDASTGRISDTRDSAWGKLVSQKRMPRISWRFSGTRDGVEVGGQQRRETRNCVRCRHGRMSLMEVNYMPR